MPTGLDIKCDVSSEDSVETAVKAVVEKFNTIDILVNCAGVMDGFGNSPHLRDIPLIFNLYTNIIIPEQPATTSTKTWTKVLSINLNGPFFTTRAILPYMLRNTPTPAPNAPPAFTMRGEPLPAPAPSKGSIINICSVASIGGGSAGTAYTVSKHGLLGLTRSTAWMHRDDGIRCNAVLPGATATNIHANSKVEMNTEGYGRCQSYLGVGPGVVRAPGEVAGAVVWLAGAENVTGAEVKVDGGWDCLLEGSEVGV